MRKNPFSSILSGFGITAIAQSSSAATVNVVSFVNAGALTLAQSILVIMGANIGASLTTWLVAILGFKLGITGYTYIIVAIGFILTMMKSKRQKTMGEIILGFALSFKLLCKRVPVYSDIYGYRMHTGIPDAVYRSRNCHYDNVFHGMDQLGTLSCHGSR